MAICLLTEFQNRDGSTRLDVRVFQGDERIIKAVPGPDEEVVLTTAASTGLADMQATGKFLASSRHDPYRLQVEVVDIYLAFKRKEFVDISDKLL